MKKFLVILLILALIAGAAMVAVYFCQKPGTEGTPNTETPDTNTPNTETPDTNTPNTDPPANNPPVTDDPEIRYTVTEQEWDAWTTYTNYTVEQYYGEYRTLNKYTADALQFEDGVTILFIGDKQYELEQTDEGYAAYDCTYMGLTHGGLLSGGYVYDEFTYNEELGTYVLDMIDEMGAIWYVRFENGIPVSIIYQEYTDGEVSLIISSTYTNVGTTVIDIPDYEIKERPVVNVRREVTEQEWNIGVSVNNHSGICYSYIDGVFETYSYQCTGNVYEVSGTIYVVENGKTYELVENEGAWTAVELVSPSGLIPVMLPQDFKYEDFEFSVERDAYIPKEDSGIDLDIVIGFSDGQILFIITQGSLDPTDPAYANTIIFEIAEFGNAVIEVPNYVFAE